jgi:hypothetical protein
MSTIDATPRSEPVIWSQVKHPADVMPKLGRKPIAQPNQKSADEYDLGYRLHEHRARNPVPFPGTPRRQGWDAAQEDQLQLNAERAAS